MQVTIKAFGITREIVNGREITLEMPEGTTVADLKKILYQRFPRLEALSSLFIAINAEYAQDEHLLKQGSEVALIPPVSGG
jgi:molybdopterin converting factor subunit 1